MQLRVLAAEEKKHPSFVMLCVEKHSSHIYFSKELLFSQEEASE